MKISLCMIVKDEEAVLERCLQSVKEYVDEIVIIDTGSTDGTLPIAKRYTDKLYSFAWRDDFAAARNFSFSQATGDYLMWMDADDCLPAEEGEKLAALRARLEEELPDMVMCPYDVAFDAEGNRLSTFYRERLLKREAGFVWQGRVHECIAPAGKIVHAEVRFRHLGSPKERGRRNLHIYQKWAAEEQLSARDLFYYGRELYYHRLYTEAIAVLEQMLCGEGWYVNKIEACKILSRCHWERGERENAVNALTRSFLYGEPRASVLCELGSLLQRTGDSKAAIFWYRSALYCRDHAAEGDFEEPTARTLVPLLQLTCLYESTGERENALLCHQKAEKLFPAHPSVLYNRNYFFAEKS